MLSIKMRRVKSIQWWYSINVRRIRTIQWWSFWVFSTYLAETRHLTGHFTVKPVFIPATASIGEFATGSHAGVVRVAPRSDGSPAGARDMGGLMASVPWFEGNLKHKIDI